MITLYQFPPCWDLPNASPFCMKVENYLRMSNLPYRTVSVLNPAKGPKGKLPFITDNGQTVADSSFILDYLKATHGDTQWTTIGVSDNVIEASSTALADSIELHLARQRERAQKGGAS